MWAYIPSTCFQHAPELADSTSASVWRSEMLASSAALNTKHTQSKSWLRAWKRDSWMQRLYGRIYEPSTASLGVDSWICSLAATRASHSAPLASALGLMIRVTSGPSTTGLLMRYSRRDASSKMSQLTFLSATSTSSSQASKERVIELRKCLLARKKSAQVTNAIDFSSWPTPDASAHKYRLQGDSQQSKSLEPTTRNWPTPKALSGGAESAGSSYRDADKTLNAQGRNWPTPTNTDAKSSSGSNPDWNHGETLTDASRSFRQGPTTSTHGDQCSQKCRRLNPLFVEWLMGWPLKWTDAYSDFDSREMESYLRKQRVLLFGSLVNSDSANDAA